MIVDADILKQFLFTISVVMPRMLATFAVIPFLGRQVLQGLVRNSIILSFAFILYPLVAPTASRDTVSIPVYIGVIGKEIVIGMLIGFLVSITFWVAENAGYLIDNQRGTTMAGVMDPMTGDQTSPLGSLFLQTAAVLFFTSGGFLLLLSLLFESYRVWPIFSFYPSFDRGFALFFLQQTDKLMMLALLFAAPVVIAIFVAELGLGLINRFSPQLNVFFLSMPIKSGIASFIIIIYLSTLMIFFRQGFQDMDRLLNFMQGFFG